MVSEIRDNRSSLIVAAQLSPELPVSQSREMFGAKAVVVYLDCERDGGGQAFGRELAELCGEFGRRPNSQLGKTKQHVFWVNEVDDFD